MQEKQTGTFTEGQNIPIVAKKWRDCVSVCVLPYYTVCDMSVGCHDTIGEQYQYDVLHLLRF